MTLPGITGGCLSGMLKTFGSPAAAWDAVLQGASGSADSSERWTDYAKKTDPADLVSGFEAAGIKVTVKGEQSYPVALAQIHTPPLALFFTGELPSAHGVAIVGSRKATPYGLEVARVLASGLSSAGISVISGAAYGIDASAHYGALEGGGLTVAVLGCGVDVVYPRSNAGLYRRLATSGALVSEYIPGTEPRPYQFPARNRIIAGLSRAVIVVEASERSGALITADHALGEGRDVMAVPGQVFSYNSVGTHALIRAGAALVTCADEVLQELGIKRPERAPETVGQGDSGEQGVLMDALEGGPMDLEGICITTNIPISRAMALLSSMEVSGQVARCAGGTYQRLARGRGGAQSSRE
jgi:DNA processing protein